MLVEGMHGLGDSLHQRAVVRQLMQREEVWLQTPWPSVYHDLVGDRLKLVPLQSRLRTQAKNVKREAGRFVDGLPRGAVTHKVWYTPDEVKAYGGFLAAMCARSGVPKGDFSLPVPDAWKASAQSRINPHGKPILVYRPLVERTEWNGCAQRNPDAVAYVGLVQAIRDRFYIVSIADLEPGKEWVVSDSIGADVEFHRGELRFEEIAGLMAIANLVFCSPGFALVLAQAVGANLAAVIGGHESARLYDHGSATDLFIQPERPCECFSKHHRCDKRIDIDRASARLLEFINGNLAESQVRHAAP